MEQVSFLAHFTKITLFLDVKLKMFDCGRTGTSLKYLFKISIGNMEFEAQNLKYITSNVTYN